LIEICFADKIGVKNLEAYGDSKIIVNQVRGEYQVRNEDLVPYRNTTINMAESFRNFYIDHVPRQPKAHADALASLSAFLVLPAAVTEKVLVYNHDLYCPRFALEDSQKPIRDLQVKEVLETSTGHELRDWRFLYIDYVLYDILPDDSKEATAIRRKASKFYYNAITRALYRRSHNGILLRCHHTKRHRKYSNRLITACVELTNLVQNLEINSEDSDIIGQR